MSFDSKIQLITLLNIDEVPLHLVHACRFTLKSMKSQTTDSSSFDLFTSCHREGRVWVGIMRYDDSPSNRSNTYTTRDWMHHVGDPFTHYLNTLYTERSFPKHRACLLQYAPEVDAVHLYFLLPPEDIDSAGFVNLLQSEGVYADFDDDVEDGGEWFILLVSGYQKCRHS